MTFRFMKNGKEDGKNLKCKNVIKNVTKEKNSFISGLQQKYLSMFNLGTNALSARLDLTTQPHSEAPDNHWVETRIKNTMINPIQKKRPLLLVFPL